MAESYQPSSRCRFPSRYRILGFYGCAGRARLFSFAGPKYAIKAPDLLYVEKYARQTDLFDFAGSRRPGFGNREPPAKFNSHGRPRLDRKVSSPGTACRRVPGKAPTPTRNSGSFRPESPAGTSETNGLERRVRRNVHPCPSYLIFDGKRPDS